MMETDYQAFRVILDDGRKQFEKITCGNTQDVKRGLEENS